VRFARLTTVLAACLWLILLVAAPLNAFGPPISSLTYLFGGTICHQRAERSFHLAGAQLPVCARCFGLYAGFAMALAIGRLRWMDRATLRRAVTIAAVPTVATWLLEVIGLWLPSNATRCLAGVPLGAAIALTVNYVECARPLQIGSRAPRTLI